MVLAHQHCITGCQSPSHQDKFWATNMHPAGRDDRASLQQVSALLFMQLLCHPKSNLPEQPPTLPVYVISS